MILPNFLTLAGVTTFIVGLKLLSVEKISLRKHTSLSRPKIPMNFPFHSLAIIKIHIMGTERRAQVRPTCSNS